MPVKVLLDTDIGTDIDDAVALAYLLMQPECELLGITTVTGEAVKRASLTSALCRAAGKDIPIYPGLAKPLLNMQRQPVAQQASALSRWPHETHFPEGQAIEFLRKTIHANPGEVTLLTIGPLTNAGLLFALDPEIPALLKGLVMMCGDFRRAGEGEAVSEWNAGGDPYATAIAYQAPVKVHRSLGLNVTRRVVMDAQQVRRRFSHPLLLPVKNFAEVWFENSETLTWHDPLAAAAIFDETLVRFEAGHVEIDLANESSKGKTIWTPGGEDTPHEIAVDVDPQRFFEHYFSVFR